MSQSSGEREDCSQRRLKNGRAASSFSSISSTEGSSNSSSSKLEDDVVSELPPRPKREIQHETSIVPRKDQTSDALPHVETQDIFIPNHILTARSGSQAWNLRRFSVVEGHLTSSEEAEQGKAARQVHRTGLTRAATFGGDVVQKKGRHVFSDINWKGHAFDSSKSCTRRSSHSGASDCKPPPPFISVEEKTENGQKPIHDIEAQPPLRRPVRQGTIQEMYEKAKTRSPQLQRHTCVQWLFEYGIYITLIAFTYLVLIGRPLWRGVIWCLYDAEDDVFLIRGGWAITLGLAAIFSFAPLLVRFEPDPPMPGSDETSGAVFEKAAATEATHSTALLIPCYKSATIIGPTIEAALKSFPPENIFIIANGNSPSPIDNTEEVVKPYGVRHIWSPVGSKIVAQFVGCHAAKKFTHVLLIDDDCALPPNFPIVADRIQGMTKCIGYTIKSVGPGATRGNWCQQAQDLEYKISGLQRALAGKIGSVTFPHGAISLWDREFLLRTFNDHPGFSVSEDWFFGHTCRWLGGRIKMCTAVFVETETPSAVFFSSGGSRGGFGEMTVFKQRFLRWNFFFVNGLWYNMKYIVCSWKLGWWEPGAKVFVLQEVYETLLYLFAPFVLPISLYIRPAFCGMMLGITVLLFLLNVLLFNEIHLRLKKERVSLKVLLLYYMPFKLVLVFVNVASCYWAIVAYARYFARRHPKIIEDEKAVGAVLHLQTEMSIDGT